MTNALRAAAAGLTIALWMPTALADDRTGFSVSLGIGTSVIRDEDGSETFRGSDFAYSFAGEYRFDRRFALGMNLFDLGTARDVIDGVDTEIEAAGFDLFIRIPWQLGAKTEVYALLGTVVYQADIRPGGSTGLFGESAWMAGVGFDFLRSEALAVRAEGRFFNGPRDESGGLLTLGFSYRFGT